MTPALTSNCYAVITGGGFSRTARLPRPPSDEVYEVFKNAPLDFRP
ncbi:hypothetical protein IV431_11085 [Rahnella victoriana]|uniref:Uncharacterized protein n=1 Tax=Rahnella victoriana TaxID=1510570 RepID=A0ABS0DR47_9GAMM|nr:cell envelope integrity TolA C-terminal domain-containing protein [Rahnella victoriana]MBF7956100.1 hypothetical protein [Rahnella victoriana]TBX35801.1 hypothetical protein EYY67_06645 [Rahnella victoriana]